MRGAPKRRYGKRQKTPQKIFFSRKNYFPFSRVLLYSSSSSFCYAHSSPYGGSYRSSPALLSPGAHIVLTSNFIHLIFRPLFSLFLFPPFRLPLAYACVRARTCSCCGCAVACSRLCVRGVTLQPAHPHLGVFLLRFSDSQIPRLFSLPLALCVRRLRLCACVVGARACAGLWSRCVRVAPILLSVLCFCISPRSRTPSAHAPLMRSPLRSTLSPLVPFLFSSAPPLHSPPALLSPAAVSFVRPAKFLPTLRPNFVFPLSNLCPLPRGLRFAFWSLLAQCSRGASSSCNASFPCSPLRDRCPLALALLFPVPARSVRPRRHLLLQCFVPLLAPARPVSLSLGSSLSGPCSLSAAAAPLPLASFPGLPSTPGVP
jgi:hypothetical protein